jgi:putative hydrolase of the HAD superfamily
MPVHCVTFDLDDTLWECQSVIVGAERSFYGWLEQHYPRIGERFTPDELARHRRDYFEGFPEIRHDLTALRKQWLTHLAETFDCGEELVDEGFRVFWEQRNAVTLYQEARAALEALHGRYALGAITNGNADVHHIGIGHFFDFVVTAATAGAAKPEPRIFHAALDAAGVGAERTVHVGDDALRDVGGAGAVGMGTVWVNADDRPWPGGPAPDAEIRRLDELEAVLAMLDGR